MNIQKINLNKIKVGRLNVRWQARETNIKELSESIKKHGLLQPIVVKKIPEGSKYDLIVGQRRFKAYKLLKENLGAEYNLIESIVLEEEISDEKLIILSFSENIHRVELSYSDKARVITNLFNNFGTIKKVTKELGLSESTVRDYINIEIQATPKMKEIREKEKLSKIDMKRAITAADGNPEKAERILEEFVKHKLTRYEKEKTVFIGKRRPDLTAEKIVEEVQKSRSEETIILGLPGAINDALGKAKKKMSLGLEEIAMLAIEEWLIDNGFLK